MFLGLECGFRAFEMPEEMASDSITGKEGAFRDAMEGERLEVADGVNFVADAMEDVTVSDNPSVAAEMSAPQAVRFTSASHDAMRPYLTFEDGY